MADTPLTDGLTRYQIGEKVRTLRLRKKMGLVELSKRTGLSSAMLSKIERGRLFPTLPTLYRVAIVLGVGLDHFFSGVESRPTAVIVRKKDRVRRPDRSDGLVPNYFFESLDFGLGEERLSAYYAEFELIAAERVHRHAHPGLEFVFVLSGTLAIVAAEGEYILDAEDAICFQASRPHGYLRKSDAPCAALVVLRE